MRFHKGRALAVATAAIFVMGTAVHVQAAELGFLEMLFGARPAAQPAPAPQEFPRSYSRRNVLTARKKLGAARHHLRTQYTALPVKIRVSHLQTPLDMKQGAMAALMKDETLRPGDIVVLSTGARVFTGNPDTQHTVNEFEPVQRSAHVSNGTRKLLAGMMDPLSVRPADEARRVVARAAKPMTPAAPFAMQTTAMRVINPWQTNP